MYTCKRCGKADAGFASARHTNRSVERDIGLRIYFQCEILFSHKVCSQCADVTLREELQAALNDISEGMQSMPGSPDGR